MDKIKKHIRWKFAFSLLAMLICFSVLQVVHAEEIDLELKTKEFSEKYVEWLNLPEEERQNTIPPQKYVRNIEVNKKPIRMYSLYFGSTSKYNLRDEMSTLKIKNQGQTDQCWAFSATTQLESYMKKVKNRNIEFSPRHIEYATARTFLDGVNQNGYYREVNSGGNYYMAYAYMTSGKGPVLEEDMPFVNTTQKINLSEIQGKQVQAQLEEYKIFPPIYKENNGNEVIYTNGQTGDDRVTYTTSQVTAVRNDIKAHIMQYGALGALTATKATQFFSDQENLYNSKAYYCDNNDITADHAVSIIGWDDNYSVDNFNEAHRPKQNGAWLIQNSYGEYIENYGEQVPIFNNGLLYISYEDVLIEKGIFGIVRLNDVDYDEIYQYDELGSNVVIPVANSEAYAANVFHKNSETEYITEIGLYLNGSKDYTYDVFVNNADDSLNKNKLKKVATVSNTDSSYTVVKLNSPIKVDGEKFAIAVRYDCGQNQAEIPIEGALYSLDQWSVATSNVGESFLSADGVKWYDAKDMNIGGVNNVNSCIKAFVKNDVDITLASSYYDINNKIIKNVSPNTKLLTFYNNIVSNKTLSVLNSNNKEIVLSELVATGMKLKIAETNDYYTIVVRGDVNGDGKITATDLLKLKKSVVNLETLGAEFAIAGDVNSSGGITSTDIMQLKQAICNLINF